MGSGKAPREFRPLTHLEVWLAAAISAVILVGILSTFNPRREDGLAGSGHLNPLAYAQDKLEELKRLPFPTEKITGSDRLDGGRYVRSWTLVPVPGTHPQTRLARIAVTVSGGDRGVPAQTITLETMRAE